MNRKLWENLASLYGVHAFNYLIPLFTLPYLARVLGPEQWGALAFADAYARFVSLAIEYGFGLSATREIARIRDDPRERSRHLIGVDFAREDRCGCGQPLGSLRGQSRTRRRARRSDHKRQRKRAPPTQLVRAPEPNREG